MSTARRRRHRTGHAAADRARLLPPGQPPGRMGLAGRAARSRSGWSCSTWPTGRAPRPTPRSARSLDRLQSAGVQVAGYVDTNYGQRPAGEALADLGRYLDWYQVTGVFFDRAATGAEHVGHYAGLADGARRLGRAGGGAEPRHAPGGGLRAARRPARHVRRPVARVPRPGHTALGPIAPRRRSSTISRTRCRRVVRGCALARRPAQCGLRVRHRPRRAQSVGPASGGPLLPA